MDKTYLTVDEKLKDIPLIDQRYILGIIDGALLRKVNVALEPTDDETTATKELATV